MRITCPAKEHKGKKWRLVSRSLQQDFFEIQLSRMQEAIFQNALRERMWKIEGIKGMGTRIHRHFSSRRSCLCVCVRERDENILREFKKKTRYD